MEAKCQSIRYTCCGDLCERAMHRRTFHIQSSPKQWFGLLSSAAGNNLDQCKFRSNGRSTSWENCLCLTTAAGSLNTSTSRRFHNNFQKVQFKCLKQEAPRKECTINHKSLTTWFCNLNENIFELSLQPMVEKVISEWNSKTTEKEKEKVNTVSCKTFNPLTL